MSCALLVHLLSFQLHKFAETSKGSITKDIQLRFDLPNVAQSTTAYLIPMRNAPKHIGTMLKLARWLRTVQQNCSASLPTTLRSYKRTISLASFICEGCGFRTGSESRHHWCTTQWAEWHSCETLSFGLREALYWPKIGLRSNLIALKFQNFPGGACPQTPLGYSVLARALPT